MDYIIDTLQTALIICFTSALIADIKAKKFYVCYISTACIACIALYLANYNNIAVASSILIIYFIMPVLLSNHSKKIILCICLFDVGLLSLLNGLLNMIMLQFFNRKFDDIKSYLAVNALITFIILLILNTKKLQPYFRSFIYASKSIKKVVLSIIWTFCILVILFNTISIINKKVSFILSLIILSLLAVTIAIFAYLIANNRKKQYYKNATMTLEENMKNQLKHYEEKQKIYEDLRRFKHDSENMKIGLNGLLENNQIEEAKAYLNKFSSEIHNSYLTVNTGSPILDALISDKQLDAKNYNTSIIFDGILSYDAIDTIDLCVTFGNALDNAIEACMKLPVSDQKTVSVCVTQNKNLLLVKISNPVAENVTVKNNSVQTTKNDRAAHGIGLYSISSTVKKYNGFCELKCENNVFTIEMGFFINRSQP